MDTYKIPTGYLIVDEYSKGQLETLSIGDYGKALSAFSGLNRENMYKLIRDQKKKLCRIISEKTDSGITNIITV